MKGEDVVVLPNAGAAEPKAADEAPNALPPKAGALPNAGLAVKGVDDAPYAGVPPNIEAADMAPKGCAGFCWSTPGKTCWVPAL